MAFWQGRTKTGHRDCASSLMTPGCGSGWERMEGQWSANRTPPRVFGLSIRQSLLASGKRLRAHPSDVALALQLNAQTAARQPMKLGVDADNWNGLIARKEFETGVRLIKLDFIS